MIKNSINTNIHQPKKLIIIVGVLLLIIGGWLWYKKVYMSSYNVFWGMVGNNLATSGATRYTQQSQNEQSVEQYTRVAMGSQNAVQTSVVIKQAGPGGLSITKEAIGTPTNEYASYQYIKTDKKDANGKPVSYASVEGVWGKADKPSAGESSFNQALLGTIPMANLNAGQREEIVKLMRDKQVFQVDYSKVTKRKDNGKPVYVYDVIIHPGPYFEMLQQFVKQLGIDASIVPDPASYKDAQPVQFEISVNPWARQLTKVHYPSSNQDEIYSSYGLSTPIAIPGSTIPLNELQQRIQQTQ